MSGGAIRVSSVMKKTIQDIREISGQHSDEDIHAMLKECSMDPNETAQRLLHLDIFHEVKKKHGRQKENVENGAFHNRRQQQSAKVGMEAKAGRGNFHFQNASHKNVRKFMGGRNENGYSSASKGHHTENKAAHQILRSDPFNGSKNISNEENIHGRAPLANEKISSNRNHLPSASLCVLPSSSASLDNAHIDAALSPCNSVRGDHDVVSNGNATCFDDKMQNGGPISHVTNCLGTVKNQLTDTVSNGQDQHAIFAAKDVESEEIDKHVEGCMSENDVSVVREEASKLRLYDGQHVVFPEHLQVPDAYKMKLTFGSFDSVWAIGGKMSNEGNVTDIDMLVDVSCPASESKVEKSATESNGVIFSTVKDTQENEDPSHPQSPSPMSGSALPITGQAMPDVVIKIDEPETENLILNGGRKLYKLENNGFSYAYQAHLRAHNNEKTQDANFSASSTSIIGPTSIINPPGSSHDLVSILPPSPIPRQTYHPYFFPYRHYYPPFIVPQVQQYMTHGGLPQPPSVVNPYLISAVAAGIKYPHQQSKQGSNAGTDSYIGVPSGYRPYVPYAFPYGLPPVVISGDGVGDDNDHETQSKENTAAHTTEQQIESPSEWTGGTARTVPGMQVNPFYNLGLWQGHPMVFPPTPAAYGAFGGVYHPSVHTIPAPQPTLHRTQSTGQGEAAVGVMPPAGFWRQLSCGTINNSHIQNLQFLIPFPGYKEP